jgi:hypothetical protein
MYPEYIDELKKMIEAQKNAASSSK